MKISKTAEITGMQPRKFFIRCIKILLATIVAIWVLRTIIRTFFHISVVPYGVLAPTFPSPGSEQLLSLVVLDRHPVVVPIAEVIDWHEQPLGDNHSSTEEFMFCILVSTNSTLQKYNSMSLNNQYVAFYHGSTCIGSARLVEISEEGTMTFVADKIEQNAFFHTLDAVTKKTNQEPVLTASGSRRPTVFVPDHPSE